MMIMVPPHNPYELEFAEKNSVPMRLELTTPFVLDRRFNQLGYGTPYDSAEKKAKMDPSTNH